jgi:hypothetical protein
LKCVKIVIAAYGSLAHLSRNNSGGSATAGIRAVGLLLHLEKLLKDVYGIKLANK